MSTDYSKTVDLLLEILPFALKDERVALKGGTAINLFHRDFARLSVDIDLCYLPLESRDDTFKNIHSILEIIQTDLKEKLGLTVFPNKPLKEKNESKLFARKDNLEVKIEPNYIIRGSIFQAEILPLASKAQSKFQKSVDAKCLNLADTYGGKICAALDRQHPRDLFDVKNLLESEGITEEVKNSFVFYLLSHGRPLDELLNPKFKGIEKEYEDHFVGMAEQEPSIEELTNAREILVKSVVESLSVSDKEFLVTFANRSPDWSKLSIPEIENYPSIQRKLFNQNQMTDEKVKEYVKKLSKVLGI